MQNITFYPTLCLVAVTDVGICSVLKAQHCVYCKLAEEGYSNTEGELKLKTEIFIPLKGSKDQPNLIGRFIGKEGQNVRALFLVLFLGISSHI